MYINCARDFSIILHFNPDLVTLCYIGLEDALKSAAVTSYISRFIKHLLIYDKTALSNAIKFYWKLWNTSRINEMKALSPDLYSAIEMFSQ